MINSNSQGRVGIDTGGTFTDCVSIDDATNRIEVAKLPSRPADPQKAVIAAFEASREEFDDDGAGHFGIADPRDHNRDQCRHHRR